MQLPRIISDIFVSAEEKKKRLEICAACPNQMTFMTKKTCGLCGCFLDAKAALKNQKCPAQIPKW